MDNAIQPAVDKVVIIPIINIMFFLSRMFLFSTKLNNIAKTRNPAKIPGSGNGP